MEVKERRLDLSNLNIMEVLMNVITSKRTAEDIFNELGFIKDEGSRPNDILYEYKFKEKYISIHFKIIDDNFQCILSAEDENFFPDDIDIIPILPVIIKQLYELEVVRDVRAKRKQKD